MESRYFLFGSLAVRRFHDHPNIVEFIAECDGELDGNVYEFDPSEESALNELMDTFMGWNDFVEITLSAYNEIMEELFRTIKQ